MASPKDVAGRALRVGQVVVRAKPNYGGHYGPGLEIKTITDIRKVGVNPFGDTLWGIYLDGSRVPARFPERFAIIKS
jgi:hypothetical protein